jgi:putative transposase
MGKSLVKNYLHITFSTKHGQKLISERIGNEWYGSSTGVYDEVDRVPVKIRGYDDHVHILCRLSKKIYIMKLLEPVKSNVSRWIKTFDKELAIFYWQDARLTGRAGYGAFSMDPAEADIVVKYITNQAAHYHHATRFPDEYRAFLKKYKVDYDEKHVRD